MVDTEINSSELAELQNSSLDTFDLRDRRRDPQTDIINKKALQEEKSLNRASQNQVYNEEEYIRPKIWAG
jgi:hypothetical protein